MLDAGYWMLKTAAGIDEHLFYPCELKVSVTFFIHLCAANRAG
jgi:hypothetical protein